METTLKTALQETVMVPIDKITSDPDQPRRSFDEIVEMAESIKTCGLLHPIMLRPYEDGYRIIFGERRYRAAIYLGLTELPATIKQADITAEEIKVIQLIENIQRDDVHPMQQATSFKFLVDERGMKTEEISQFIGKSAYFVRQQLKLNDLTEQWQTLFLKDGISLGVALLICTLPSDAQKQLYKDQVNKDEAKKSHPQISINTYLINKYKGSLNKAAFDLTDRNLDKKAGACTTCPFNSAHGSLFVEYEKNPHCNHIACFKNKTALHLQREIEKVLADPTAILVYDGYSAPDFITKIKDGGVEVFKLGYSDDCRKIDPPSQPDWNAFQAERKGEKISDIKQSFKQKEATYEQAVNDFESNLAMGKYKKALVLYSNSDSDTGRYVFVEMIPKTPKVSKKAIEKGNPTIEEIDLRIKEIQRLEVRAKELDQEKVHRKIVEQLKADKTLQEVPTKPDKTDSMLITFLLIEMMGYHKQSDLQKIFKNAGLSSMPLQRNSVKPYSPLLSSKSHISPVK